MVRRVGGSRPCGEEGGRGHVHVVRRVGGGHVHVVRRVGGVMSMW